MKPKIIPNIEPYCRDSPSIAVSSGYERSLLSLTTPTQVIPLYQAEAKTRYNMFSSSPLAIRSPPNRPSQTPFTYYRCNDEALSPPKVGDEQTKSLLTLSTLNIPPQ
ncbi:hypothetical protein PG990_008152 [Apiospora arundinis]